MKLRPLYPVNGSEWRRELDRVGADPATWSRLRGKCMIRAFRVDDMITPAANILKQCMLSGGADAVVSRGSVSCADKSTPALVVGTPKRILQGCRSLKGQPFGLSRLADELAAALENPPELPRIMHAGDAVLDFGEGPLVMGILNVTPDSFSDGGRYLDSGKAFEHGLELASEGADIIDVGAESTRPGSSPVEPAVQIRRIVPVVERLAGETSIVVSVDTSGAEVAEAAIRAGARMINDVTAFSDPDMIRVAAEHDVPVVLMHMKGIPSDMQKDPRYDDVIEEILGFLEERVNLALNGGIDLSSIVVDPGIGFGKRLDDNIMLINRIGEFRSLGTRVLLGHSRKSFLGMLTGFSEPAGRDPATHAVTALCAGSADIFRVHDVRGTRQVLSVCRGLGYH